MTRARPEQALHRQVAEFLTYALGGSAWWTTFPSGGGGLMRGKILNSIGLKPGVPDILIVDGGRALWLELKAKRGQVSEAQRHCHSMLRRARSPVAVCKSVDEVMDFLHHEGVPLKVAVQHTGTAGA